MPHNPPQIILDLITRFENNIESYRSPAYNETQLRREFIDPFFDALGWDVANKDGHAEAYKDVIHEDAIKVGMSTKAPDYCFRIGGARKFFLEAKKPAVNIKDDPEPAYQLRRYAWSAKLPLSIVTDFEEFVVYDCRTRPRPNDKPSTGRILYMTYADYVSRWDEIAGIFSKDAVLKGSFDKFAVFERKRGTATVDAAFLAEIEGWRDALARNLALRNAALSMHELNFAVQRTIDRIIFLRICEDRGVETYGELRALLNGENVYDRLRHLYRLADERYNSGLFHFQPEKGRAEAPDTLTPTLRVDDKVLKDIIGSTYYPESPYEFSVFPIEILGQVYEQFLGKVIRLTPARHAKVEDKPEVKKAGGVFYTPAYIVDYIVKRTVGELCEGKTPKQIAKLRILDPACGSGSFLIGAYTYLLDHHRDWYLKEGAATHTKEVYQGAGGQWYLTTPEKKRILLSNIYGVDIDSQAVEVTKLSLLLKVLEGESQETISRQLKMWRERALPDLGNNIKCGNSLIGPDYFSGQLLPDEDAMRRINPFDWKTEFPEIMKGGGFDVVIGNPPYGAYLYDSEKSYLLSKFTCQSYQLDSYLLFLERAVKDLLIKDGFYGMIIPNPWLTNLLQKNIRRLVTNNTRIHEIVHFRFPVFPRVTVDTEIVILQKTLPRQWQAVVTIADTQRAFEDESSKSEIRQIRHEQQKWQASDGDTINIFTNPSEELLAGKCARIGQPLSSFCDINVGIKPYQTGKGHPAQTKETVLKRPFDSNRRLDNSYRPYLRGSDIGRYAINPLEPRYIKYGPWLAEPRPAADFDAPIKIVMRQTGDSLVATIDLERYLCLNNMHVLLPREVYPSPFYMLGVINSKLLNWYYHILNPEVGEALAEVKKTNIARLPIRSVESSSSSDRPKHDKMVVLVERMLDMIKRLANTKMAEDLTRLQRQIDATDREIDRLVYDLYGLTEEEIAIVEGAGVASEAASRENTSDEHEAQPANQSRKAERQSPGVAEAAQYTGESGGGPSENVAGAGRPVDGVRERNSEYGPPQDPPEDEEERVGSTRLLETAEGPLPYRQVSERLAVALAGIFQDIVQIPPEQVVVTPEWLCLRHQALAGVLFPAWAGRYRDVNVQVGPHTPPPFYEVPGLVRSFCDDLAERLRHVRPAEGDALRVSELLAWTDWRLQWIHPFKDFNGRIGRVLLAAVLYKLALPHVVTAPLEQDVRRRYLDALHAADGGDLGPLTDVWLHRLAASLS